MNLTDRVTQKGHETSRASDAVMTVERQKQRSWKMRDKSINELGSLGLSSEVISLRLHRMPAKAAAKQPAPCPQPRSQLFSSA